MTYQTKYHFVSKIGFPGTGKGQILEPTDLSIDMTHNIMYVADKDNNRIQKFDTSGNYIASWGSEGSDKGQFKQPADLAIDFSDNIIFVVDIGNNRIQKFDTNGKILGMWGSFGRNIGYFDHPGDIALDTEGKLVYVVDIGNHRVHKFDYDGKFISSWGSLGTGEGRFNRPAGVTYDSSGIVFVVDTNNNRVQKFDEEGNFLGMWGQLGKGRGQFDNPVSLNIDPTSNYLYISDSGNKRIEIFNKNGNYIDEWGVDGTADGEFERPVSVSFGDNGRVYVVDKDRGDIQVFSTSTTSASNDAIKKTTKTIKETEVSKSNQQFSAKLSGSNEVPPTDSKASGTASFTIRDNAVYYKIEVSRMEDVTGAHLHNAKEGSNGDVVAILDTTNPAEGSISSFDLTGPLERKTINDLVDLMGKGTVYVNLHSPIFPDGEIRGHVKPANFASSPLQTRIQPDMTSKDTQLVSVIVYNANKQMGTLNICAFDGTEPISNCVNANIGNLADSKNSDRFEAALLKVKTDKNLVKDSDITVCFDPLSEQRYSWGGCWDIQNTPNGELYTEYDMTGLK